MLAAQAAAAPEQIDAEQLAQYFIQRLDPDIAQFQ